MQFTILKREGVDMTTAKGSARVGEVEKKNPNANFYSIPVGVFFSRRQRKNMRRELSGLLERRVTVSQPQVSTI